MNIYLLSLSAVLFASSGTLGLLRARTSRRLLDDQRKRVDLLNSISAGRAPAADPWSRIARLVPDTATDLAVLRDHWRGIDAGLDAGGLTVEEDALRRALRTDLPRIAETLEGAMAVAHSDKERRVARSNALGSLEDLLRILNAHREAVFAAACSDQRVVGRYLETKRSDVAPSGSLALPEKTPPAAPRTDVRLPMPTIPLARTIPLAAGDVHAPVRTVTTRPPACGTCGEALPTAALVDPSEGPVCRPCRDEAEDQRKAEAERPRTRRDDDVLKRFF